MAPQLKTLSTDEIEYLLGVRPSNLHPLDIFGYGYSSEGAHRFRAERPDFTPQIAAHVQAVLAKSGIFPEGTDPTNPGFKTFIFADGAAFRVSSPEEVGFGKYQRIQTPPLPEPRAIHEYIRRVANPDYLCCTESTG